MVGLVTFFIKRPVVLKQSRCPSASVEIAPKYAADKIYTNLTFICPCIANTFPKYNQQDATFLDLFISTDAVHVSGGSSTHYQEHLTVHTASGIVNQYCSLLLSWMRWNAVPSHPRQQECWLTIPEAVCTVMCS